MRETPPSGTPVDAPTTPDTDPTDNSPADLTPVDRERGADDPVHAAPVPADPTSETPAAEPGPAKTSLTKTSLTKTPLTKTPLTKTPLTKTPLTKTPLTKTPPATPPGTAAADPPVDGDGDDAARDASPPHTQTNGRRALLPLVLVGLLTVAMIAGVAFLGLRLRSQSQTDTAREEALVASRDAARVLFSYDHATLDADFERGLSVTTGAFKTEYARTTKEVVSGVATQYKAVVVADVVESAVVGASPREVTTVVFLNQATTSTQVEGRKIDQSRVRMRLIKVDDRWLVSKVDAL